MKNTKTSLSELLEQAQLQLHAARRNIGKAWKSLEVAKLALLRSKRS